LKAAIEQMKQEYAFSERRACWLMMLAVTTYRYRSQRSDEPLRTRLVELEREATLRISAIACAAAKE